MKSVRKDMDVIVQIGDNDLALPSHVDTDEARQMQYIQEPNIAETENISGADSVTFPGPLNMDEIEGLQLRHGTNVVDTGKKLSWYRVLLSSLVHPFNILLFGLAIFSGVTDEFSSMFIMLVMVFLSSSLRFVQEWRSQVSAQGLISMISKNTCVLRYENDSKKIVEIIIPTKDVVPGDWVLLSPGDLIPADIQIMSSKDLFVSQASLTGESLPVEKYADNHCLISKDEEKSMRFQPVSSKYFRIVNFFRSLFGLKVQIDQHFKTKTSNTLLGRANVCFMGTSVVSGNGTAFVLSTGNNTYFGIMAVQLTKRRPENAFQLGVRRISWIFFILMASMVPLVLIFKLQVNKQQKLRDAVVFALSVAVGLTPEMLPMILSATSSKGAQELAKRLCIVKQFDSIINLGSMNILCTDKTGTLTENKVVMIRHIDGSGLSSMLPLQLAFLNSYFQTGQKNILDVAIIQFFEDTEKIVDLPLEEEESDFNEDGRIENVIYRTTSISYTKVNEIPFDFIRRRMTVILRGKDNLAEYILISKGAVDEMLLVCSHIYFEKSHRNHIPKTSISTHDIHLIEGKVNSISLSEIHQEQLITDAKQNVEILNQTTRESLLEINEKMNQTGLRVVAVAFRHLIAESTDLHTLGVSAETNLIFAGFIGFLDPPKQSTAFAIKNLIKHNIEVKVLTGDSPTICQQVCEQINLPVKSIVTTKDIEGKDSAQLAIIASQGTIFAKMTPLQKAEIIRALKLKNTVGFLGDGINDSPALVEADVGISVDTGADIAKDTADIILLEKDLNVLVEGVVIGRITYGNTLKYIVMVVSSNFGNVFSMLVASSWLRYDPMRPIQLLVQNLLYDISQTTMPWDNMDADFLLVPHQWSVLHILRFMVWMGPWSSFFDIMTFLFMYYYYEIYDGEENDPKIMLFQSTWFTVGLLTQTLIVHMIRTPKIPFIQSTASIPVCCFTVIIMLCGLVLPYIPWLGSQLHMVHLKPMIYPFLVTVLLMYCLVAQVAKMLYVYLFKTWF